MLNATVTALTGDCRAVAATRRSRAKALLLIRPSIALKADKEEEHRTGNRGAKPHENPEKNLQPRSPKPALTVANHTMAISRSTT